MILAKCASTFLIFLFAISYCNSVCVTSVNNFKKILVLTKNNAILYPNINGDIVTNNGDSIHFACPGSKIKNTNVDYAIFTCVHSNYVYKSKIYQPTDITCNKNIKQKEKKIGICLQNKDLISIGFDVQNTFLDHIQVCWDNVNKAALYAYAELTKYVGACPAQSDRISFRTGAFFDTPIYYTQESQNQTLLQMFTTIPPQIDTKNLLEIGHLVAKCDFLYDVQQKLTFQYINAAPQWKSFNGGNWKLLEANIRNLAKDLEIYTGTYGVQKINGKHYYLNYKGNKIPVPQFFWKVIIRKDGASTYGIAIIGSNDIFQNSTNLCNDIISQVSWLKIPKANSVRSGYIIACHVNEFKNINGLKNQLPNFPTVTGIL